MMMQKLSKRTWGLILASLIFVLTLLNTNQPLLQLFNLDFAQLAAQPWWLRLLSFAYYLVLVIALGWWLTRFGGLWLAQEGSFGLPSWRNIRGAIGAIVLLCGIPIVGVLLMYQVLLKSLEGGLINDYADLIYQNQVWPTLAWFFCCQILFISLYMMVIITTGQFVNTILQSLRVSGWFLRLLTAVVVSFLIFGTLSWLAVPSQELLDWGSLLALYHFQKHRNFWTSVAIVLISSMIYLMISLLPILT